MKLELKILINVGDNDNNLMDLRKTIEISSTTRHNLEILRDKINAESTTEVLKRLLTIIAIQLTRI